MIVKNGSYTDFLPKGSENVPDGEYWTVREYAENENKTENAVRTWIKRGQLKAYKINGKLYIEIGTWPRKRK